MNNVLAKKENANTATVTWYNSRADPRSAEDFAMRHGQPTVRGLGPGLPRRGDLLELRGRGQSQCQQVATDAGVKNPVGPHSAPPLAGRGRRVAPDAARGRDVLEA